VGIGETITAVVGLACVTGIFGIAFSSIARVLSGGSKVKDVQLRAAEERARLLEAQLDEMRRHNELLQRQVKWHGKLIETQDRAMKQLGAPATDGANGAGRAAPAGG
jgi:type II secretory pathway pseudopilin PulG